MNSCGRRRSVSSWGYVALAYVVVWGAVAGYALVLARRITQAQRVADSLRDPSDSTET